MFLDTYRQLFRSLKRPRTLASTTLLCPRATTSTALTGPEAGEDFFLEQNPSGSPTNSLPPHKAHAIAVSNCFHTMLSLEHCHRQQFLEQMYELEQSIQAPFPDLTMDPYDQVDPMSNFHPLPYSYLENPSMFTTAPMPSMKQEMQQFHELPPALISSGSIPSIPSAPSSTVGSPYSGPSHTISSQDGFEHHGGPYGLGMMPTILNNETFSHDMMGNGLETELSLDKISDNYVGECADLSSSRRQASNVPPSVSQSVRPASTYQPTSFTASPESLSIRTFSDHQASSVPSIPSSSVLSPVFDSPATERALTTPIFKSPTTPASAQARHRATVVSPIHERSSPQIGVAPSSSMIIHRTNTSPPHQSSSRFQSHFFAQSSGSFMPPLESSCSSFPSCSFLPFLTSISFLSRPHSAFCVTRRVEEYQLTMLAQIHR